MRPTYDENPEFWTEARCIQQRSRLLNVLLHPEQFPRADDAALWRQIEALEEYMLRTHATERTLRVLCGED